MRHHRNHSILFAALARKASITPGARQGASAHARTRAQGPPLALFKEDHGEGEYDEEKGKGGKA